jgi:FtsP/CotA-like multicopper oxidase with cupredoxin domain
VQSFSTEVAHGATTALTWAKLNPGTYLIESGTHPSIQGPMGLYGVLVVTTAPAAGGRGVAYSSANSIVNYDADVPMVLGEIDPVLNREIALDVVTTGFVET